MSLLGRMLKSQISKVAHHYIASPITSPFKALNPLILSQSISVQLSKRSFNTSISRFSMATGAYEGDGKTVANDLSKELSKYVIIETFNQHGFRLSNNSFALGAIILFPHVVFQWKVKTIEDITVDSLWFFKLLEPNLDILVVGIGDSGSIADKRLFSLKKEMKDLGVNVEFYATRDAIATYNYLLSDHRVVGGAFLPPMTEKETKLFKLRKPMDADETTLKLK